MRLQLGVFIMKGTQKKKLPRRYELVAKKKVEGASYTPRILSDFVAEQILDHIANSKSGTLRLLDPAIGEGELLSSMLRKLSVRRKSNKVEVFGYETDCEAIVHTKNRLLREFPKVRVNFENRDFLESVLEEFNIGSQGHLFQTKSEEDKFDVVIANPPYVRTQIMGASRSKKIAKDFGLSGRVDLYHAFILGIGEVLKPSGIAGVIVSNRFMTTKAGASIRTAIREQFDIIHVWDLGDTKLFNVAVLPAVLLLKGKDDDQEGHSRFTSIYETTGEPLFEACNPIEALDYEGTVQVDDGRNFTVRTGVLNCSHNPNAVWRISTKSTDAWLSEVGKHAWGTFRDIGKVRVGVKTCADKVFIRSDWHKYDEDELPELLRPLTTHHIANRFRALSIDHRRQIVYPHDIIDGKRQAVNLHDFPKTQAYLRQHRDILEGRKYVLEGGRKWYEIWVPQNPAFWDKTKLIFRDISEQPVFWVDKEGSVVNGDCYWLFPEGSSDESLIWLAAAVGNSTFIEKFYDHSFNNKLYAGRRRFMTQYVEKFPLPDPNSRIGKRIIRLAMKNYLAVGTEKEAGLNTELDSLVWQSFGLRVEKI